MKEKSSLNLRCNLQRFLDVPTSKEHTMLFRTTVFAHFLEMKCPKTADVQLIADLVSRYDPIHSAFKIGGHFYSFTPRDVHEILGLPNEGTECFLRNSRRQQKNSRFHKKYMDVLGSDCLVDNVCLLLSNLYDLADDESKQDFVRCWICLLCGCFLYPYGHIVVHKNILTLVDELGTLHNYNWSSSIFEFLHVGMTDVLKNIADGKNPGRLKGCSLILMVWFMLVCNKFPPDNINASPAMNKWQYNGRITTILENENITLDTIDIVFMRDTWRQSSSADFLSNMDVDFAAKYHDLMAKHLTVRIKLASTMKQLEAALKLAKKKRAAMFKMDVMYKESMEALNTLRQILKDHNISDPTVSVFGSNLLTEEPYPSNAVDAPSSSVVSSPQAQVEKKGRTPLGKHNSAVDAPSSSVISSPQAQVEKKGCTPLGKHNSAVDAPSSSVPSPPQAQAKKKKYTRSEKIETRSQASKRQ